MKKIIAIIIAICLIYSVQALNIDKKDFIENNNIISLEESINDKLSDFYEADNNAIVILIEQKEHIDKKIKNTLRTIESELPKNKCAAVISYVKDSTLRVKLSSNCIDNFPVEAISGVMVEKLKSTKEKAEKAGEDANYDELRKIYSELLNYVSDSLISSFSEGGTEVGASKEGIITTTEKGVSKTTQEDVKIESPIKEGSSEEGKPINLILVLVIAGIIIFILIPKRRKSKSIKGANETPGDSPDIKETTES